MTAPGGARSEYQDLLRLPHAEPGNRIGIFGGSFNPPHSGHWLVASTVMKRLDLDQIWWLVTPGNPLKDHADLAPLEMRLHLTSAVADHPKMKVTAFEEVLGTPLYRANHREIEGLAAFLANHLDHGRGQPRGISQVAGLAVTCRNGACRDCEPAGVIFVSDVRTDGKSL